MTRVMAYNAPPVAGFSGMTRTLKLTQYVVPSRAAAEVDQGII